MAKKIPWTDGKKKIPWTDNNILQDKIITC